VALYLEHFGLAEPPFRITPHTDFFFEGADRGATLEALIYAIQHDEGIVKVSGEVGSGKTMLCRVLMERLPANVVTIYLATPSLARDEILYAIGDELDLRLSRERTSVALRELQEHLIRLYGDGRRVVILIDEAHKLLQIVLFGQPELDAMLAKSSLRQLRDRITHAFRMRPLSGAEVGKYLSFRMRAAGYRGPDVFTPRAVALLGRASNGLNRRINILADKALLSAFTENGHAVTHRHVGAAVRDSEFAAISKEKRPILYVAAVALIAGVAIGLAGHWAWLAKPAAGHTVQAAPAVPVAAVPVGAAPLATAPVELNKTAAEEPQPAPPAPPASQLNRDQARRLDGYSPGGRRLLAERIAATRDVLGRAPDEGYSIELFITDNTDPARMERFLLRAREMVPVEELFVIPMAGGGQYRLRVVYGEFANRNEAAAAGKRLPPKYQQAFRTSLRSFAELRGQI
jgi:MSHA biogenesis protein MshM